MAESFDMTGFQTNAFGQDINAGGGFWDFAPTTDVISAPVEEIYPDANIPLESSTSVAMNSNSGSNAFSSSNINATANGFAGGVKNTLDYALKLSDSVLKSYGSLQNQQTQRYLATTQADIMRTNAQTSQEVARLTGQAKVQGAQMIANAARSGAGLTAIGQTNSSFMLYLTILGVVFAGIQILKSAK